MEFLKENFEIIMLVSVIIIVILIAFVISINKFFMSYYLSKKFKIEAYFEVDAKTTHKKFTIKIYNNNINDIRVSGFGFLYRGHNIDFYNKYLEENILPSTHKLVIPSRDYITVNIFVSDLKNIIFEVNKGKLIVKKLSSYATDSLGLTTQSSAYTIRKQLGREFRNDKLVNRVNDKKLKKERKLEEKEKSEITQLQRRQRYLERKSKLVLFFRKIYNSFRRSKK